MCFWIGKQRAEPNWLRTEAEQRNTGSVFVMSTRSDLDRFSPLWKFLNSGSVAQLPHCSLAYNLARGRRGEHERQRQALRREHHEGNVKHTQHAIFDRLDVRLEKDLVTWRGSYHQR